jgi:hypothetical protein
MPASGNALIRNLMIQEYLLDAAVLNFHKFHNSMLCLPGSAENKKDRCAQRSRLFKASDYVDGQFG